MNKEKRMSASKSMAVVGIAVAAALGLAAAPASANSPTAYHEKTQFLTKNPDPFQNAPSCVPDRIIQLGAGNYTWNVVYGGLQINTRTITLKADYYKWTDCLTPVYNASTQLNEYEETTTLTPQSGGDTAFQTTFYLPYESGTFAWGSELNPWF
jgi:hypothetical protein